MVPGVTVSEGHAAGDLDEITEGHDEGHEEVVVGGLDGVVGGLDGVVGDLDEVDVVLDIVVGDLEEIQLVDQRGVVEVQLGVVKAGAED